MSTSIFQEPETATTTSTQNDTPATAELVAQSGPVATAGVTEPRIAAVRPPGWPNPLEDAALHGLAGDVTRIIDPHTEADPVAILLQLLVAFGNVVGRNPYFLVEATRHYPNLFLTLVGDTAKARKGTSWGHVDHMFRLVESQVGNAVQAGNDHQPWSERVVTGLSSGEGLIWAVRDPIENQDGHSDPGVSDKRRIVIDGEFASTLKMLGRQGNTLSPVMRNAWDSGDLRILTKNSPAQATGAHISIIGHITRDELRRELTATEMGNGFANRFLWACVRRSKVLPEGGDLREGDLRSFVERLAEAVGFAYNNVNEMKRDDWARLRWHGVYPELSEGKSGMFGAVTARAEAQVIRIACLYALLDQSPVVQREHLEAALAVWTYCEASARLIFGDATGDPVADQIRDALQRAGSTGMSRTQIRDLFQRNQHKERTDQALALLKERRLAEPRPWRNGKREIEMWLAL